MVDNEYENVGIFTTFFSNFTIFMKTQQTEYVYFKKKHWMNVENVKEFMFAQRLVFVSKILQNVRRKLQL